MSKHFCLILELWPQTHHHFLLVDELNEVELNDGRLHYPKWWRMYLVFFFSECTLDHIQITLYFQNIQPLVAFGGGREHMSPLSRSEWERHISQEGGGSSNLDIILTWASRVSWSTYLADSIASNYFNVRLQNDSQDYLSMTSTREGIIYRLQSIDNDT